MIELSIKINNLLKYNMEVYMTELIRYKDDEVAMNLNNNLS